jgi:hypothetical protein
MQDASNRALCSTLTLMALLPLAGCSGASAGSGSGSGACATLQSCCSKITDPSIASSCMSTLGNDQSLPTSDQTCAGSLNDYVSFCESGGKDGGLTEGGPRTEGGSDSPATGPTLGFTPSNVDLQGIDTNNLPAVDVMTTDCTIDTGCSQGISCAAQATVTKTIIQNSNNVTICVYYVSSFKIDPSAVLKATGGNPVAIVSLGTIDIEGRLLVDATGGNPIAGGGGSDQGGPSNVGAGQPGGAADDGVNTQGASGGGYCGVGGAGGTQPAATATSGGIAWGTPQIVPLAGGAGGGDTGSPFGNGGGGGGGAVQLVAKTSITLGSGGLINAGGGGGNSSDAEQAGAGGGGGSGGAILLEAPTTTLAGVLAANGGGGGGGGNTASTNGVDATANSSAALGGSMAGGSGSAAKTAGGAAGGSALSGQEPPAGGGGAGRIRINATSGKAMITGTLSPSMGTCTTQGTLGS